MIEGIYLMRWERVESVEGEEQLPAGGEGERESWVGLQLEVT